MAALESVTWNSLWLLYSDVWLGGLWSRCFPALKQMKSMAQEDWSAGAVFTAKKVTLSQEQIKNQNELNFQQMKENFQKHLGNLISFLMTKSLQRHEFSHRPMLTYTCCICSLLGFALKVVVLCVLLYTATECQWFIGLHTINKCALGRSKNIFTWFKKYSKGICGWGAVRKDNWSYVTAVSD